MYILTLLLTIYVRKYVYLETTPIIEDDHIQILKTGADCDDHPAYQQAVISFQSPKYQHETTNDSKECVKNCIFNHWTKAHILQSNIYI